MSRIVPSYLVLTLAVACSDTGGVAPMSPASAPRGAELTPGSTISLATLALATHGLTGTLDWTSRDTDVVALASGAATAHMPGETYLIATDGVRVDSVPVVVHFAGLADGDIGL